MEVLAGARRARLVALLSGMLGVVGCGGSKRSECNAVMGAMNQGLRELENGRQQQKNDATKTLEIRAMADAVEKTGATMAGLQLSTPELKAVAQRYEAMSKDVAKHARAVADAHDKGDQATQSKSQGELSAALKLEDPIVHDLNKLCAP